MYHSRNTRYPLDQTKDNQIVVEFRQTSHFVVYSIGKTGLKGSNDGWIGPGIYFAILIDHTEFKPNQFGAYICAKIDLGKTRLITNSKDWSSIDHYDAVRYQHSGGVDEFYVKNSRQIRSWSILIGQRSEYNSLKRKKK